MSGCWAYCQQNTLPCHLPQCSPMEDCRVCKGSSTQITSCMQVYSQIYNTSYAYWGGNTALNYTSPVSPSYPSSKS